MSKDETFSKIKKFEKDIDILLCKKDKNMWQAINKGIKLSSGKVIGIINSGDIYYKNTFKIVEKYFNLNNDLNFLFGPVKKDRVLYRFEPEKIYYRFNIYPSHSSGFFITRHAHKKIGFYNDNLKFGADHDLFYRMIVKHKLSGMIANKKELFGKFDMTGASSKIPFYKSYFYEMVVRHNNDQNIVYLFFLYFIKIMNKFLRVIIK